MTWEQVNKKRIKHIRFGERLFYRMYGEFRRELAGMLQRVQTPEEIAGVVDKLSPSVDLRAYFLRFYVRVGMDFAQTQYTKLKAASGTLERKDLNADIRQSTWLEKMIKYVDEKCGFKITMIIQHEIEDIVNISRKAIAKGINEGWGVDKIVREMMLDIAERDQWKAMRIARTEVVSASNEGAYLGAVESGVELDKIWLATGFPGPSGFMRDDHDAMNGVKVNINDDFILPDGTHMPFPGEGPPEHVINCRCTVAFEPKEGTDIVAQELGEI